MRGTVTLYNRLNHCAEFSWTPVLSDHRGTAFTIRPASGLSLYISLYFYFYPLFLSVYP